MEFKPLTAQDYPTLRPFFANQRYELCEYCLATLLAWTSEEASPYGAVIDNTLVVSAEYRTRRDDRHLILPLAPDADFPPAALHALARACGHEAYWFVPDSYLAQYGEDEVGRHFTVIEQPGFADYIYRTDDLATLAGNRYAKKRNLIHQFQREYLDRDRVRIEAIVPANVQDCLDFLEEWCRRRRCAELEDPALLCEKEATGNALRHLGDFGAKGLLLRIDDTVSAIGIASPLTADMGVLRHERAFEDVKGLYQYFDSECARRLFPGFTFINKESDMENPGIRKAKRSYHPTRLVHSFCLRLRL